MVGFKQNRLTTLLQSAAILIFFATQTYPAPLPLRFTDRLSSLSSLVKRAVTYGDTKNTAAASSVCNTDQKGVLEQAMTDTVALAKAGSDGLTIILDMLTDEKTKYYALEKKERKRYRETYFTLFGQITKKDQFATFSARATYIKDRLDTLMGLTKESWPDAITFFCDSTYYQDKDDQGRTWDKVDPPLDPPAANRVWKFDLSQQPSKWATVLQKADCNAAGTTVAAWTLPFYLDSKDRITWCPAWFDVVADAAKSFDPTKDIKEGTVLKQFTRTASRIFLHEHLHTATIGKEQDKSKRLDDTDNPNSYGPDNAERLASKPETQDKANRNIENVVYWCIAMLYKDWDWSTLSAKPPSE